MSHTLHRRAILCFASFVMLAHLLGMTMMVNAHGLIRIRDIACSQAKRSISLIIMRVLPAALSPTRRRHIRLHRIPVVAVRRA